MEKQKHCSDVSTKLWRYVEKYLCYCHKNNVYTVLELYDLPLYVWMYLYQEIISCFAFVI